MAAPTAVVTVIKRFTYRGNTTEEFSNTYMLTGVTPADATAWRALFDALVTQEKTLYKTQVSIIGGYGYDSPPVKGDSAVWTVDLTVSPNTPVPGTYAGTALRAPGDSAAWIRWPLDRLNSKGKRIYLRKYYHPAYLENSNTNPDAMEPSWLTAANAFATKLDDGSFLAGRKITDRLGTATLGHAVASYATTRTLKRRGKRPPT